MQGLDRSRVTASGVAPRVVMETLGHSQISITMDVYTHVTWTRSARPSVTWIGCSGGVSTVSDRPG
ncbi:hypothetical protein GCM10010335_30700 [Streptomyces galbus]|nr:hypothetical protein GCM10010335_30700 [Streptomyces galbus]